MTKRLNAMTDDGVEAVVRYARRVLATDDDPAELWEAHFMVGAGLYQQDAPVADVRAELVAAIEPGLAAFAMREPAVEEHRPHVPWDFGTVLGLTCAFGTTAQRERATSIERWKFLSPEAPDYAGAADTLQQLQASLRGQLDPAAALGLATRHRASDDRNLASFDAPLLDCLVAVHGRDATAFERAVVAMLDEHGYRALEGECMLLSDGLLAALPLGLVQLGTEAGLACAIASPYLPLELLVP